MGNECIGNGEFCICLVCHARKRNIVKLKNAENKLHAYYTSGCNSVSPDLFAKASDVKKVLEYGTKANVNACQNGGLISMVGASVVGFASVFGMLWLQSVGAN